MTLQCQGIHVGHAVWAGEQDCSLEIFFVEPKDKWRSDNFAFAMKELRSALVLFFLSLTHTPSSLFHQPCFLRTNVQLLDLLLSTTAPSFDTTTEGIITGERQGLYYFGKGNEWTWVTTLQLIHQPILDIKTTCPTYYLFVLELTVQLGWFSRG